MQLSFAFGESAPTPRPAVWVLACLDKPTSWLARHLSRFNHVFVDARDGSTIIGRGDALLVRDRASGVCSMFTCDDKASGRTGSIEVGGAADPTRSGLGVPLQRLVAIFLGSEDRDPGEPDRDGPFLERLLMTLRHPLFERSPMTRLQRSTEARAVLSDKGDATLLALLDREGADAARSMHDVRTDSVAAVERAWQLHRKAARQFRIAGLPRMANRADRAFRVWASSLEPTLALPASDLSIETGRIRYEVVRLLAFRMPAPGVADGEPVHARPVKRRPSGRPPIDSDTLCGWVGDVGSSKVAAWHEWESLRADRSVLRIGVDNRFSVELGLAGRTGLKQNTYSVRVLGRGCQATPDAATLVQGEVMTVSVETTPGSPGALEVLFVDDRGSRLKFGVRVPAHGIH